MPTQIITSNTVWDAGTVTNLTGDVQIAAGAMLTIQPGAVVRGNGYTIQAFGTVDAAGSDAANVLLDNVQLGFGSINYAKTGQLNLDYVTMIGGSLTPPGNSAYGNYQITNSRFEEVSSYTYVWYPYGNNLIAHNDFHKFGSFSIGGDFRSYGGLQSFIIRDNSFKNWTGYPYDGAQYRTDNSLIVNWVSYGEGSPQVTSNNFFDVGKTALAVQGGYSNTRLAAMGNWFGTTDSQDIANMIYDRTDDLNAASVISNTSPLSGPSGTAWNIVEASAPGATLDVTQGNTIYYGTPYQYWSLAGELNPPSTARLQSLRLADLSAWVVQADGSLNVQSALGQNELVGFRTIDLADATLTLSAASGTSAKGTATVSYKAGYWPAGEPGLDKAYYLRTNPDVAAAKVDPLAHYQAYGWHEGRNPNAYFDVRYYLAQNPDVAAARIDPLLHYEQYGWREGRDPSLLFSNSKYLAGNPDVQAVRIDPLQHFIQFGQVEGRMAFLSGGTAPADLLVNAAYYDGQIGASLIPSGMTAQQQAAWSYHTSGWQRSLNPSVLFDTRFYLSHNPDVVAAHIDPLQHYEQYGWKEGRDPSTSFSTNKYLESYADVKAAGLDPLLHYVAYGQAEGRTAFAV